MALQQKNPVKLKRARDYVPQKRYGSLVFTLEQTSLFGKFDKKSVRPWSQTGDVTLPFITSRSVYFSALCVWLSVNKWRPEKIPIRISSFKWHFTCRNGDLRLLYIAPLGQNFCIFMQFSGKSVQIVCCPPPPPGVGAAPLGKSGLATTLHVQLASPFLWVAPVIFWTLRLNSTIIQLYWTASVHKYATLFLPLGSPGFDQFLRR